MERLHKFVNRDKRDQLSPAEVSNSYKHSSVAAAYLVE